MNYDTEIDRLRKEIERLDNLKEEEMLKMAQATPIKQEPTTKELVKELYSMLEGRQKKEIWKKAKIRKARVRKSRIKKGWVGIFLLNENRNISQQKTRLEGGTFRLKDSSIRVTNGKELMFWEGKYPILFQRYDKLNPTNLYAKEGERNEIYGQELVELRMKKDLIKEKTKGRGLGWIYIVAILIGGYFILKAFFPNLFGG